MMLKEKIERQGKKLIEYYSYCGALFSSEYLEGNPFGYKFSWSPLGVLKALKNNSKFLMDGKVKTLKQKDLLHSVKDFPGIDTLNLFVYPNRDSVSYKNIYDFKDCHSLLRGTIRYKGFCEILAAFNDLGLLSTEQSKIKFTKWTDLISHLISIYETNSDLISSSDNNLYNFENWGLDVIQEFGFTHMNSKINFKKFLQIITHHKSWKNLNEDQYKQKLRTVLKGFDYLEILSKSTKIPEKVQTKPFIEILCKKMKEKLSAEEQDRDLVIMVHYFVIKGKSRFKEIIKSSMIVSGESKGLSAVSKTVGFTVAIAASKVLEGVIQTKGVIGPFIPEVYNSVGKELEKIGLFCTEYPIKVMPKL